jgi:hypothetical protein
MNRSVIKRNIYLLVLSFVIVIAIIISAVFIRNNSRKAKFNEAKDILIEIRNDIKELKEKQCPCQKEAQ